MVVVIEAVLRFDDLRLVVDEDNDEEEEADDEDDENDDEVDSFIIVGTIPSVNCSAGVEYE